MAEPVDARCDVDVQHGPSTGSGARRIAQQRGDEIEPDAGKLEGIWLRLGAGEANCIVSTRSKGRAWATGASMAGIL